MLPDRVNGQTRKLSDFRVRHATEELRDLVLHARPVLKRVRDPDPCERLRDSAEVRNSRIVNGRMILLEPIA